MGCDRKNSENARAENGAAIAHADPIFAHHDALAHNGNNSMTSPTTQIDPGFPAAQGLYDPANEKDACGVGFVAKLDNVKSHEIIEKGLEILLNLDHRGAVGADPGAGDGCGMLIQVPHEFLADEAGKLGFKLPAAGEYGVAAVFLPRDAEGANLARSVIEKAIADGRPGSAGLA